MDGQKKITYEKIYLWSLTLVIFFQTLLPKTVPVFILIVFFTVSFGAVKGYLKWQINSINVLFVAFYLSYLIGTFYTKDPGLAKIYLENKASFFIFPVLFSFKPDFQFSLRLPAIGFISSVLLVSLYGLFKMTNCMSTGSIVDCLPSFSSIHHPSYFSAYILVSIVICLYGYHQRWKGFGLIAVIIYSVYGLFITLLSFSLAGILFLAIVTGWYIWFWMKKKYGWKITVSITAVLLSGLIFFVSFSGFREDFKYTSRSISSYIDSPEAFLKNGNRYLIGNEVRLILWTVTGMIIAEHPLGVGTGNTDIYITEKLQSYGLYDLASYKYNPHNQFLQTFLEVGIVGFVIMFLIILVALRQAIYSKNWLLLVIVMSLVFNSLFESMLQRQSGIVFYAFWICWLYTYSQQRSFSLALNNKSNE